MYIYRGVKTEEKRASPQGKTYSIMYILVSTRSETDREMIIFLLCSGETCNEIGNRMINS